MFSVQKSQITLNEFELDSIDIMCSPIIDKYIICHHQNEFLSLTKFSYFYNIKKITFQNIANPK
jgi:hypothetical protein